MVLGTVLRSHSGGYLVFVQEHHTVYFCTARGRIKKEGIDILTGDQVVIDEIVVDQKTAVITTRLERHSLLSRPPIANVDQVIIVQAVHQPEWNPLLCDRYIVHFQLELPSSLPVVAFNKCDLASQSRLTALRSIYEPLGYFVTFVSAKTGQGLEDLVRLMSGKTSVMAGQSGVGKSSLLNALVPELKLKTGKMENEFGVGRHTTTATELFNLGTIERYFSIDQAQASWVADTPGFNILELRHPSPAEVVWQFPEILELAHDCKFINCLHLVEHGCHVLENIDKVSPERYSSYGALVSDAQSEYRARKESSQKVETNIKAVGGKSNAKQVPKLSGKYRAVSRRRGKQDVSRFDLDEDLSEDDGDEKEASDGDLGREADLGRDAGETSE
jgi:ribosome biogenesis GTPase